MITPLLTVLGHSFTHPSSLSYPLLCLTVYPFPYLHALTLPHRHTHTLMPAYSLSLLYADLPECAHTINEIPRALEYLVRIMANAYDVCGNSEASLVMIIWVMELLCVGETSYVQCVCIHVWYVSGYMYSVSVNV